MKITKKLLFLALVCLLVLSPICLATNAPVATSNDANNTDSTNQNESINIVNKDIYTSEKAVVIENAINGNLFAVGSDVTIKGEIAGDVFVCANTLTIEDSAVIYSNLFALASNIVVKGNVNDAYVLAKDFELASGGYIYRDLKLYSETAKLNGIIKKDAYIYAKNITFAENVKGLIGGNLNYTSSKELSIPNGVVSGEVKYTPVDTTVSTADIISSYITSFITTIIYAIVVILLATFFAPKFIEKAQYALTKRPFVSAGIGILSIVLVPVFALLILMLGVFSYVSLAIFALYVLILSITLAIFSMIIAKLIEKKLKNPSKVKFILFSILSAIVLWILRCIPFVGGYVSLFITVVGLGVFLFAFFMRKDPSELQSK